MNLPFFNSKSKAALYFGIILGVIIAARCIWLWQPERQLERHHRAFIEAIEDPNWKALRKLVADDFKNPFGFDKERLLREAGEARRHFFAMTLTEEIPLVTLAPTRDQGTVESLIRIQGNGTAIAGYIIEMVNRNQQPFLFNWKQQSWKPWDWQLVAIEHPFMERSYPSGW